MTSYNTWSQGKETLNRLTALEERMQALETRDRGDALFRQLADMKAERDKLSQTVDRLRAEALHSSLEAAPPCDHQGHIQVAPQGEQSPAASCSACGADLGAVGFHGITAVLTTTVARTDLAAPRPESMRGALIYYIDHLGNRSSAVTHDKQPHPTRVWATDQKAERDVLVSWNHGEWVEDEWTPTT